VHLLSGEQASALDLEAELQGSAGGNKVAIEAHEKAGIHDKRNPKSSISAGFTTSHGKKSEAATCYGTEGREFESLRARSRSLSPPSWAADRVGCSDLAVGCPARAYPDRPRPLFRPARRGRDS
jgi:hypothetical protein